MTAKRVACASCEVAGASGGRPSAAAGGCPTGRDPGGRAARASTARASAAASARSWTAVGTPGRPAGPEVPLRPETPEVPLRPEPPEAPLRPGAPEVPVPGRPVACPVGPGAPAVRPGEVPQPARASAATASDAATAGAAHPVRRRRRTWGRDITGWTARRRRGFPPAGRTPPRPAPSRATALTTIRPPTPRLSPRP